MVLYKGNKSSLGDIMPYLYKKLDNNTLEVTDTNVYQESRQELEEERERATMEMIEIQKRIDGLKTKIAILDEV